MAVHLNMVSVDSGRSGSAPKAVSATGGSSTRPRGSTNTSVSEPNYNQPITSSRSSSPSISNPSGSSTRSSAGSSGSSSYSNVGSNSIDFNYANLTQKEIDEINKNAESIFGGESNKKEWSIFDWDGDGKKVEWLQAIADLNMRAGGGGNVYNADSAIPLTANDYKQLASKETAANIVNTAGSAGEGALNVLEFIGDALYEADQKTQAAKTQEAALYLDLFGNENAAEIGYSLSSYYGDDVRIAKDIAYDYSDAAFDAIYSTKAMSDFNDSASKAFYRDPTGKDTGFVYSVVKDVTEYTPAIVASSMGGPVAQAAMVSLMSYGKYKEKNYKAVFANAESNGQSVSITDLNVADAKAALSATVDGSIVLAAGMSKASIADDIKSSLDALDIFAGETIDSFNKQFANHVATDASIGIKALKPYVKESIDTFIYRVDSDGDGEVDNFDWKMCGSEALAIVAAEKVSSLIGDGLSTYKSSNSLTSLKVDVSELTGGENSLPSIINKIADNKIATDTIKRFGKQATGDLIDEIGEVIKGVE